MLEVNNVSLTKDAKPLFCGLSFTVGEGEVACVTGGTADTLSLLLHAMMGLYPTEEGHVSIDGELLTPASSSEFRKLMAYVPHCMPPFDGTVGDVLQLPFNLEANKTKSFSRSLLLEEWRLLGLDEALLRQTVKATTARERQFAMISLAGVLGKPIVLVDGLAAVAGTAEEARVADYLHHIAQRGASVVAVSVSNLFAGHFERRISLPPLGDRTQAQSQSLLL
jgi:putative ABC transport system ATP-binding protein